MWKTNVVIKRINIFIQPKDWLRKVKNKKVKIRIKIKCPPKYYIVYNDNLIIFILIYLFLIHIATLRKTNIFLR